MAQLGDDEKIGNKPTTQKNLQNKVTSNKDLKLQSVREDQNEQNEQDDQ